MQAPSRPLSQHLTHPGLEKRQRLVESKTWVRHDPQQGQTLSRGRRRLPIPPAAAAAAGSTAVCVCEYQLAAGA